MSNFHLESVVTSQKKDGSWQSLHVPSGKVTHGLDPDEAVQAMQDLLGMADDGSFAAPLTSDMFSGLARDIALYLEGEMSHQLSSHSGFARLQAFDNGTAHVRLGGGCEGCPSSMMTLMRGVKTQLQDQFGDEQILEVVPATDG